MSGNGERDGYFDIVRETMDWDKRREDLNRRFLETFQYACRYAKAYRDIYGSAGIDTTQIKGLDDLEKLPVLRIPLLVKRQKCDPPFGGFETPAMGKVRRIYVNPGLIWQPGDWEYQDTTWAEALAGAGFKAGDRIINTFNYHLWPFAFILDECVKMIGATVIPTGVGNTLMQARIMHLLKVNGFMGTPSFLMTLTQRAEAMGMQPEKDFSLDRAFVSAEMLPESLRSRIEKKLQMSVRQGYGTVFLGCIGYECPYMNGLHMPDNIMVEVVDPNTGKQVPSGAAGEIVATNLSTSYPLIRMATGDLSMQINKSCPCGRTGPMLRKIIGRIDQATKVRGTFIHPWQADEVISRHPEVYKYQVVITRERDLDVMTFVVETKEEISRPEMLQARMERDIKEFLTVKGLIRIVPRGTIPDLYKKIEDRRTWE